jgi:pimeloyl-ACP methyl ester carboxylesterase
MQYAIHRLGFKPEQIVVMGWSIGGYAATWLAMNYPDIKGLVRSCYVLYRLQFQ